MTRQLPDVDDLLAPEVIRDPYPTLARLRREDPVHYNARWKGWVLTSYDVIGNMHRNPHISSERYGTHARMKTPSEDAEAVFETLSLWLGSHDPPLHTRLRNSIKKTFTPRAIEGLGPLVERTAETLLDAIEAKGTCDLVADYGYPLTSSLIAGLLGMPLEDTDRIAGWADGIAPVMFMTLGEKNRYAKARAALEDVEVYFRALVERRISDPRHDIVSELAELQVKGEMSPEEVVATCGILVFGGHETTTDLISNGTLALLQHPDQLDRLHSQPELMESAVEEMLRFDSPAKSTVRWVKEDFELAGRTLEAGQRILMFWAAANRDPDHFADPDRFDIARSPNDHLAFGRGIHFCIGAPLARLEGKIAFTALLRRFPRLRLDAALDELRWHQNIIMRSLEALPVAVD